MAGSTRRAWRPECSGARRSQYARAQGFPGRGGGRAGRERLRGCGVLEGAENGMIDIEIILRWAACRAGGRVC